MIFKGLLVVFVTWDVKTTKPTVETIDVVAFIGTTCGVRERVLDYDQSEKHLEKQKKQQK
jgi:hypothetical protein